MGPLSLPLGPEMAHEFHAVPLTPCEWSPSSSSPSPRSCSCLLHWGESACLCPQLRDPGGVQRFVSKDVLGPVAWSLVLTCAFRPRNSRGGKGPTPCTRSHRRSRRRRRRQGTGRCPGHSARAPSLTVPAPLPLPLHPSPTHPPSIPPSPCSQAFPLR